MALNGDTTALRLCLERLIPPIRATEDAVKLPQLKEPAGLSDSGARLLPALADGQLTPTQATGLIQALAAQAKLIEIDDLEPTHCHVGRNERQRMSLEKRVVALEERLTPRRFINLMTFTGETEDELIERYREEHGQNSITDSDTVTHTSIEFVAADPSRYTEYPDPS